MPPDSLPSTSDSERTLCDGCGEYVDQCACPLRVSAEDTGEPLIELCMTREVATKLVAALGYGAAVAESAANKATPETRAKIDEHSEWLRWGYSRLGVLTGRFDA